MCCLGISLGMQPMMHMDRDQRTPGPQRRERMQQHRGIPPPTESHAQSGEFRVLFQK